MRAGRPRSGPIGRPVQMLLATGQFVGPSRTAGVSPTDFSFLESRCISMRAGMPAVRPDQPVCADASCDATVRSTVPDRGRLARRFFVPRVEVHLDAGGTPAVRPDRPACADASCDATVRETEPIGVGRDDWFRLPLPPNRTGGSPASGSPVGGLTHEGTGRREHGLPASCRAHVRRRSGLASVDGQHLC